MTESLGISGRIAERFQSSEITPLLALVGLLLGLFAILVTPREEKTGFFSSRLVLGVSNGGPDEHTLAMLDRAYLVLRHGEMKSLYAILHARVHKLGDEILHDAMDPFHREVA